MSKSVSVELSVKEDTQSAELTQAELALAGSGEHSSANNRALADLIAEAKPEHDRK